MLGPVRHLEGIASGKLRPGRRARILGVLSAARSCKLDSSVNASNPVKCSEWESMNHKYGLRTVAVFETFKGVAVVALCLVLLSLLHKDLDAVVDQLTDWLRLNPDSRVADWFYELADRTTGRGIWAAVTVGPAYASCRFVEGLRTVA